MSNMGNTHARTRKSASQALEASKASTMRKARDASGPDRLAPAKRADSQTLNRELPKAVDRGTWNS